MPFFGVVEDVGAGYSLCEAMSDHHGRVFFLPAVGGHACTIHVPEKLGTHGLRIFILLRQVHVHWWVVVIQLGIEVCPFYVDKADLRSCS